MSVRSFIERQEQQFSNLQDLVSLNYPELISVGKCCLLFPIDEA